MQYLPEPILLFLQASSTGSIEQYTVRSSAQHLSSHFHFTRANTACCGYWTGFTNRNSMHMLCPMLCAAQYPQSTHSTLKTYLLIPEAVPLWNILIQYTMKSVCPELSSFKPRFSWQLQMIFNYAGKAKYVHKRLEDQCSKQWLIAETLGIQAHDDSRGIQGHKNPPKSSLKEYAASWAGRISFRAWEREEGARTQHK